jgi:hypothetical protein
MSVFSRLRRISDAGSAWIVGCALLLALPTTARALEFTVPDDFPTIQSALDALAVVERATPDTLRLRGLDFAEMPTVRSAVVIEWAPASPAEQRPRVAGLAIELSTGWLAVLRGVDVTGPVTMSVQQPSEISFEDCRFDGSILGYSSDGLLSQLTFRRCELRSGARLAPGGECVFDSCDVVGGISVHWSDARLRVLRSMVHGAGTGAGIYGEDLLELTVSQTTIRGFRVGMFGDAEGAVDLSDNMVEDCAAEGILVSHGDDVRIARNVVRRCGTGVSSAGYRVSIAENVIEACVSTGVFAIVDGGVAVTRNVITRCGAAGIWLAGSADSDVRVQNNTVCANAESGVICEVESPYSRTVFEIVRNVAFGNSGYGLEWRTPPVGTTSCNDWFGNALGPVAGGALSPADFLADPLFCDALGGDLRVSSDSPLSDRTGCGPIGALGIGCAVTTRADAGFRIVQVSPSPAAGPIRIDFTLPAPAEVTIEVFDVQGRKVATPARGPQSVGRHTVEWSGRTANGVAAAGIYLVRYRFPGGHDDRRLVLAR